MSTSAPRARQDEICRFCSGSLLASVFDATFRDPTADERLLRSLFDDHAGPLYGYALRLTGDPGRAEDVVQETLLRAWRNPDVLADRPVRAWLFTVARNLLIDQWRMQRTRPETSVAEVPDLGRDDENDQLLLSWVVAEALTRLSPEHRAVLVECYYGGRSVAEAARHLGIPEGTVKSRAHYALRSLRLQLEEMGVAT